MNEIKKPFWKNMTFWTIVSLIFFAPVGIFLMWFYKKDWNKNLKIALTVVSVLFFAFGISQQGKQASTPPATQEVKQEVKKETPQKTEEKAKKAEEERKKAEEEKKVVEEQNAKEQLALTVIKNSFNGTGTVEFVQSEKTYYVMPTDPNFKVALAHVTSSSEVKSEWLKLKENFKSAGDGLTSVVGSGYSISIKNPTNESKVLLVITDGKITYDAFE